MAIDTRDWYVRLLRKRLGYVERARFRMSEADVQRGAFRRAWARNLGWAAVLVAALLVLAFWARVARLFW